MGTPAELVAEIRRDIQDIKEAHNAGNTNTVQTTFNAGGFVGMLGIVGIALGAAMAYGFYVKAEAREAILTAQREADLRDMAKLRGDMREVQAYTTQYLRRLTIVEAKVSDEPAK